MKAKKILSIMTAVSMMCTSVYADSTIINENGVAVKDSAFNKFDKTIVNENIIKDGCDTEDEETDDTVYVADNKQEETSCEDTLKDEVLQEDVQRNDVKESVPEEDASNGDDIGEGVAQEDVSQTEAMPEDDAKPDNGGTNNTIANNNQIYMENVVANEINITIINYNQITDQASEEKAETPEDETESGAIVGHEIEYDETEDNEIDEDEFEDNETEEETYKHKEEKQRSSRHSGGGGRSSSLNKASKTETSTEITTNAPVTALYAVKPQERTQYKFQIDTKGFWAGQTFRGADTAPYISNGRTMLPLRLTGEALGFNVSYDAESKTASLSNGQRILRFTVGSDAYTVDGQKTAGTGCAEVRDSRIFLPIRDVSNALGMEIMWNQADRTAIVTK